MTEKSNDSPQLPDYVAIRQDESIVIKGNPSEDEVAAVTVAIVALARRDQYSQAEAEPRQRRRPKSLWARSSGWLGHLSLKRDWKRSNLS